MEELIEALELIAGSHWERVGYCQTDIDDVPDLTALEAMHLARTILSRYYEQNSMKPSWFDLNGMG